MPLERQQIKQKLKTQKMTNKLINKLGIGALTLALAGSFWGCGREIKEPFCKTDSYKDLNIKAGYENGEKYLFIDNLMALSNYRNTRSESFVVGSLLDLLDSKEIQLIYDGVKNKGIDCNEAEK